MSFFRFKLIAVSLLMVLSAVPALLYAQNPSSYTLRGLITDFQTGEPLEFANVQLVRLATNQEAISTSNSNGVYEFRSVLRGSYRLSVRFIGYENFNDTLVVDGELASVTLNIRLRPTSQNLSEVVVSGNQQLDVQRPGQVTIRSEDFRRTPTPAGSADLMGYLQSQPGIVVTGDRGGQLFVRGGLPSENMVLMDGSMVFQPFHIIGFFSIFPEEVVSKADLFAGGFGPRYSSRTSSVMDVKLKNGNLYDRKWSASLSPYLSSLYYESPIEKGKSSFFVSARGSLIEESSQLYLSEQQPLKFNSQLIKYSNVSEQGFNCSAHVLRTYDRGQLDYTNGSYFKWNNVVTGGRCAGVSQSSNLSYFEINVGISYASNEVGTATTRGRNSTIMKSQADVNFMQNIGSMRLDYGAFVAFNELSYDIADLFAGITSNEETMISVGMYSALNIPLAKNMSIDPGVVMTTYLGYLSPSIEPRVQATWSPRGIPNERLNLAWGLYKQPIVGIADFRDAGTAFTAYMPIPDDNRAQSAEHFMAGWHQPIGQFINMSIEGYYKRIKDVPVSVWSSVARFTTDLAYADGEVFGSDFRFNFNHRFFYGSVGYGFSWTEYTTAQDHFNTWFGEPVKDYNPPQDRRHQVTLQTGYERGLFKANISWVYGSGFPFTQAMGFDSFYRFEEHIPNVTDNYGTPRVLMEKAFRGRLPDFHRMDASVQQGFIWGPTRVNLQGGVLNAYNWNNIFYYDVFNQNKIMQLPLMPYLSIKFESK